MKGSNQIVSDGYYGIMGVENPLNEPIARMGGNTFTDKEGNLWLFGGMSWHPAPAWWYFGDLWKYNPSTNNWVWMKGSNNVNPVANYGTLGIAASTNNPGPRDRAVTWTDDSGNLWMFGGDGYDRLYNYGTLNDLWKYDQASNNWTWIKGSDLANAAGHYGTRGVGAADNLPPARGSAVSWKDNQGNFWVFGGYDGGYGALNDLWRYNIASNQWTWVNGVNGFGTSSPVYGTKGISSPQNDPAGRFASSAWVGSNGDLYLFGGIPAWSTGNAYNDLWKYNIASNEWTWLNGANITNQPSVRGTQGAPGPANTPGARYYSSPFQDLSGDLYIFGGYEVTAAGPGSSYLNDLWKYSPASNQWTWLKGGEFNAAGVYGVQGVAAASNKPGGRGSAMSWSDGSGNFWLFGGTGHDATGLLSELNDLWKINGLVLVPVKLISFAGQLQQQEVLLQWEATELSGTSSFVIERSFDGRRFDSVGKVMANMQQRLYHFSDPQPGREQNTYYRLKIIEQDGSYVYSRQVVIAPNKSSLSLYPNPASHRISFTISAEEAKRAHYNISDVRGRKIVSEEGIQMTGNTVSINISSLSPGSYLLTITSEKTSRQAVFIKR